MLHQAIGKNDWNEVQKLLNISYINVNERDKILQTPLHAVCTSGHKQLAETLIEKKADINAVDANNWAPIHCAAANSQLELVELLLNQINIKPNILSKDGTSMFHYLMRTRVPPQEENNYLNVLKKAKEKGSNITLHGKHLETPLHQAALRANLPALQFLLDNNANIDAQNKFGETVVHYAVRGKDKTLVQYFIQNNADLSIRSRDGTPFDIADDEIKQILNGSVSHPLVRVTSNTNIPSNEGKVKLNLNSFNVFSSSNINPLSSSSNNSPSSNINDNNIVNNINKKGIDPHQLQVQQHMLTQYTTQAYQNGIPSSLPIFCEQCLRPFTYPVGAISIKCPMCLTVNAITK